MLWVVWDGASFDVVSELLDGGDLPALRSLCDGRVVPIRPLSPNCQTPPSLASKFTGAEIAEHGVTGFRMPVRERAATFVESRSGFDPTAVRRPLIWDRAAAAGVWVGLSHVPWAARPGVRDPAPALAVDAFERCLSGPGVVPFDGAAGELDLGGQRVALRRLDGLYEAWAPTTGARVELTASTRLQFAPAPLRLGPGRATRLGVLARPDGGHLLVHTGLWEMRTHPPASPQPEALDAGVGAFVGKLLGDAYHDGELGPRLVEGGAGGAEEALLASASLQAECFTRSCELVLRAARPDGLVISYLPLIDEVQHELFRWWAADAREVIRRAYALADAHLARLLRQVGPRCTLVLSSDHGGAVLRRSYHVNETLARAGLAAFDDRGLIDVHRSCAAYHPAGNGSLWINTADRPGGVVAPALRRATAETAARVLSAARDPRTGRAPVDVRWPGDEERGWLGDLFLRTRPGYECRADRGPDGAELAGARSGGTHSTPTGESTLRGVLAVGGGHVEGEASLSDVHALVDRLVSGRGGR